MSVVSDNLKRDVPSGTVGGLIGSVKYPASKSRLQIASVSAFPPIITGMMWLSLPSFLPSVSIFSRFAKVSGSLFSIIHFENAIVIGGKAVENMNERALFVKNSINILLATAKARIEPMDFAESTDKQIDFR